MSPDQAGRDIQPTRIIALGSRALTDGFSLIGVETLPDATAQMLEALLEALVTKQEKALLFLEQGLAQGNGHWLKKVRNEGGRIVLAEIPELHAPGNYHPAAEEVVRSVLGPSVLEEL